MNDFDKKIEILEQKLTPETVVNCKKPSYLNNVDANKNWDFYNEKTNCTHSSNSGYHVLNLNSRQKVTLTGAFSIGT